MTNKQKAKINMYENMSLFFNKYETSLMVFATLWLIIEEFFDKMTAIDAMLQLQQTETAGETKNKLLLLKAMSDSLLPLSRKARVWAKQQKNSVMEQLFDITESLMKEPNLETLTLARNVLAGLNANAAALLSFNITAAQLADAGDAINNFEATLGLTAQAQNVAKSGTEGLAKVIADIKDLLYDTDDLLISEFNPLKPAMVIEYKKNRRIGNPVSRHTTITLHAYTDAAKTQPLAGATITLTKYNLAATTDVNGTGAIEKFKGGELSVTASAVGYANNTIPFTIKNGQHVDIDAVLTASAPLHQS